MTWEDIVQKKLDERQDRLPAKWLVPEAELPNETMTDVSKLCATNKWLVDKELAITSLSVVNLAKAIADKRYTAVQVVEAFAHRATIAQQLINP